MIYSNNRKLALSGWLKQNSEQEYNSPLKLQKFLLFYEAFTKAAGETPDLDHLCGYKRGPVFSNVWGDYTKERVQFDIEAHKCDIPKLTEQHFNTLYALTETESLYNPVYVEIDEEGRLVID